MLHHSMITIVAQSQTLDSEFWKLAYCPCSEPFAIIFLKIKEDIIALITIKLYRD